VKENNLNKSDQPVQSYPKYLCTQRTPKQESASGRKVLAKDNFRQSEKLKRIY
jgi:hypothetical protein